MNLHPAPRKTLLIAAGLAAVIAILAAFEIATFRRFRALVKTHNHRAAAIAAADTIMQMNTNMVIRAGCAHGELPTVLVTMHPRYFEITPRSMRMVFRGGVYPYGFQLVRTQNGWDYSCYSGRRSRVLHSISNR